MTPPEHALDQSRKAAGSQADKAESKTPKTDVPPPNSVLANQHTQADGDSLFTIFVADESRKTDKRFARAQALTDAARIRKSGTLSTDERQLVRAKLRFFEGAAWETYSDTIRPALAEVTREEIQMEGDDPGGGVTGVPKPEAVPGAIANHLKTLPEYIDNNIKKVSYFGDAAIIYYEDGSKFELGLSSQRMKPPVVEVDYFTLAEEIRPYEDTSGRFGYMNESEMAQAPRTMPYQELLKTYLHNVEFYVEKGTGRIVPTRINTRTAPTLCAVLLDSLRQWDPQVKLAVELGVKGTAVIGAYAGAGGLPSGPGVAATSMFTRALARAALSTTGRKLAREMDALLASGLTKNLEAEGVDFISVEVSRQRGVLAVKRFMTYASTPGQGIGYRMAKEFEDAAVVVGRVNGAKTVTVNVGVIVNKGWQKVLAGRGYGYIASEGGWIKTIPVE
jgi:hypothetical protein